MANPEALFSQDGQVWSTDGTLAGTGPFFTLPKGQGNAYGFSGLADGTAVFVTFDGAAYRIYDTNGTAAGTAVIDTVPVQLLAGYRDTFFALPLDITALRGGQILFDAGVGSTSYVLQTTDGTAASTGVLANVDAAGITPLGTGRAVFEANNELWGTDGTTAGTVSISALSPGDIAAVGKTGATFAGSGKALFAGSNGSTTELYITDGTVAGTSALYTGFSYTQTISPVIGAQASIGNFTPLGNGTVLFSADDGQHGTELWATDGLPGGTNLVKDINPGPAPSNPGDFTAFPNGTALFTATDGSGAAVGLWTTNGSASGTTLVTELPGFLVPSPLTLLGNGKVVFQVVENGQAGELWVSDGTAAGTYQIATPASGTAVPNTELDDFSVLPDGDAVFLATNETIPSSGATSTLWVTDGTAAGTTPLTGATIISDVESELSPSLSQPLTLSGPDVLPALVAGVSTAGIATITVATTLGGTGALQFQPGTQTVQFLDATLGIGPASNEAFLARVFAGVFGDGQNATAIGTADDQLASGVSQAQVVDTLLGTAQGVAEYGSLSNTQFATTVFQGILGRTPSASDLAGLTILLASGTTRGTVAAALANAVEAQAHDAALTTNVMSQPPDLSLTYNLFQTAVGLTPTTASETGVLSELRTTGVNALQVAEQFTQTAQFQALHASQSNGDYIASVYQAGLGRLPTSTELATDVNLLGTGAFDRAGVLLQVALSPEATAHLSRAI